MVVYYFAGKQIYVSPLFTAVREFGPTVEFCMNTKIANLLQQTCMCNCVGIRGPQFRECIALMLLQVKKLGFMRIRPHAKIIEESEKRSTKRRRRSRERGSDILR